MYLYIYIFFKLNCEIKNTLKCFKIEVEGFGVEYHKWKNNGVIKSLVK